MSDNQYKDIRAKLSLQKKEVISKLLNIWLMNPELRLGQLLVNALSVETNSPDIFYIEDYHLLDLLEQFDKKQHDTIHPQITIEINRNEK